jgi:carboxyl-terminal processing protease
MNNKVFGGLAVVLAVGATGAVLQRSKAVESPRPFGSLAANGGGILTPPDEKEGATTKRVSRPSSPADEAKTARLTVQLMESQHYSRRKFDDALSAELLQEFMDSLDPQHLYFTQGDADEFAKYKTTLDDLLRKGDTSPAKDIFKRFMQRAEEQNVYVTQELKNSANFTFTGDDSFLIDRKTAARPKNTEEQKALWLGRVRSEYLQEKLNKTKPNQIADKITKRYTRLLRTVKEYDSDDIFELYLNSVAHVYDPHSDYFGRSTSENFSIALRLSLVGIGASLQSDDGYVKVMELTPGGPAERSGLLKPGDRITAVAQGKDGVPVDVVDMKIDRVVELIRGEKGTTVRLTIWPANAPDTSTRRTISITRDQVNLSEQGAKGRIIETPGLNGAKPQRLGVVDLPSFYADTQSKKSATADVAQLLTKFKQAGVSGVILDLRRNGGGSLQEAIDLTGLFIKNGPVVQVRESDDDVKVDSDENSSVVYAGPLVVLTSRFSASASEIVAGALQDYGRAVVVGDSSTFGKGTVQAVLPLGRVMEQIGGKTEQDPGSLKLTIQKFYRASGSSTQLKGVVPDIVLPSLTDVLDVGEKSLERPLEWDTIDKAPYRPENQYTAILPELQKRSAQRVATNPDFKYLQEQITEAKKNVSQKSISLNEAKRVAERQQAEARSKARQKQLASRLDLTEKIYVITLEDAKKPGLPKGLNAKELAQAEKAKRPQRVKNPDELPEDNTDDSPERDILMDEAERVLADIAQLSKPAPVPQTASRP